MKIYLAALTHNHKMVANEAMPLVPAYIKCYLESELPGGVNCTIFCYPDKLEKALADAPPDMLMVSNYVWNEALSLRALAVAKQSAPEVITIMGGPNFSSDPWKRERFLRENPQIDAIILGEAEVAALHLATELIRVQGKQIALEGSNLSFLCRRDLYDEFHEGRPAPSLPDLNSIPSPWLSGVLDEFFDGNLAPLLETTRGCSCHCLYCVQGADTGQKVRQFAYERIQDEICYIARRISQKCPKQGYLAIADPEFGAHVKDVIVAESIREQRQRFGWPKFIDATTGKNRQNSVLDTMSRLKECLTMYNSVQTMNPAVAKTIRRHNHSAETLSATQLKADSMGITSLTETILGLPGEGYESHKQGMFDLLRAGFKHLVNYQCMILKGADLETDDVRARHGLQTMYRAIPRCNGRYAGDTVIEVEEIVVTTPELSFEDYLKTRRLHLVFFVFHSVGWFEPLYAYLLKHGIDQCELLELLATQDFFSNRRVSEWMNGFLLETRQELFETAEKCRSYYTEPARFARLQSGEIGGNLMFKYLAIGLFNAWEDIVDFLFETAKSLLPADRDDEILMRDLQKYVTKQIVHGDNNSLSFNDETVELYHDIPGWAEAGYKGTPECCELDAPIRFNVTLGEERKLLLGNALSLYGTDHAGIAKLAARTRRSDFEKMFCKVGGY